MGIDVPAPRLFWRLESSARGERQTAWQILVSATKEGLAAGRGDLWDSGRMESDESIHIRYAGAALASSQRVFWKVRVWDRDGRPSALEPAGHVDDGRAEAGGVEGHLDRRAGGDGDAAAARRRSRSGRGSSAPSRT